jgi:hypothetical protein
MRSRWRDLLGALGVAGALLTLVEPRWRMRLLRLATLLAPIISRQYGLVARSAYLLAVGRLLDSPESPSGTSVDSPSLVHLLVQAGGRAIGRAAAGRGRWGLRARRD